MARLSYKNLSLEIRYRNVEPQGWIQYDVLFLYKGEPLIQDRMLKRINEHWQNRDFGAFKANEDDEDSLIPTIQKALDTDQPQYWEPIDPDVIIAIYPQMVFPFQPSKWKLMGATQSSIDLAMDRMALKEVMGGRLSDDPFTIIVFVDIYNFGDERGYQGQGPALIMGTTRHHVLQFMLDLRQEYETFCQEWEIKPKPQPDESSGPRIPPPLMDGMIFFDDLDDDDL